MLTEEQIRRLYERSTILFARFGTERFMYESGILAKVLEIDYESQLKLIKEYEEMYAKESSP